MSKIIGLILLVSINCFGQEQNPLKLGIGVVAIDSTLDLSNVVTIYSSKNLSSKFEDFKLSGESKTILPFYFKPDYGICYFICLEKQNGFYKILVNASVEGYLPNTSNNYFKSWESLLTNSKVERLDTKANPLKEKPSDSSRTLDPTFGSKPDRLEVLEVVESRNEYWIRVGFSKSGKTKWDKGTSDCGEGWIKWRIGNRLLVSILLLC